jgi:hypothetical protein
VSKGKAVRVQRNVSDSAVEAQCNIQDLADRKYDLEKLLLCNWLQIVRLVIMRSVYLMQEH